jgi:hypothetical protein
MFHFQVAAHAAPYATSVPASHWRCSIAIAVIVSNPAERRSHLASLSLQSPLKSQAHQKHTLFARPVALKQNEVFAHAAVVLCSQLAKQCQISHPYASQRLTIQVIFVRHWTFGHQARLRGFA